MTQTGGTSATEKPPGHKSWHIVPLFLLAYTIAQADKQALSLAIAPIQQDLQISDAQIGLLQGAVFAVAFSLGGLPMGWLVDRGNRALLAGGCIIAWSLATALSGLANGFAMLAVCRALTAFFEAGLAPAAFSLFSTKLLPEERARASATYMLAPFLGAGAAMIGGGSIGAVLPDWPFAAQFGFDATWRLIFLFIGAPGILLGVALPLLVRDVRVRPTARQQAEAGPAWLPVIRALFERGGFLRSYQFAMALYVAFLTSYITWYPTFLIREVGLTIASTGIVAGSVYMLGGIAGTVFTIVQMRRDGSLDRVLRWIRRTLIMLIPLALLLPLVSSMWLLAPLYLVFAGLTATVLAVMVVPLQLTIPAHSQGKAIGIFTLMVTGVAGSLGPLGIGLLTQHAGLSLGIAMLVAGGTALIGAIVLMPSHSRNALATPAKSAV